MINQGAVYQGFRLLRPLGLGWLGEVYAAQDLDAGETLALRVLAPEHLAQPQLLAQYGRLFEKVRRLKHPNILELGEYIESEQRAYATMTLAQSGSTRQLLQSAAQGGQYLDLLLTVDLARQTAAALAYAHSADLMHGDLKPENVLLRPARELLGKAAYTAQVSDFGVGELRAYTYGTHDRLITTTPAYMAPEQCRGVRGERRSDIYALGVMLYEMLTGMVPFETRDLADALQKHQHVAPIPPGQIRRDIPEDLEEIVLTCLAKAPEYRYASAGDLENALQGAMNRLMPQGPNPTVVLPDLPLTPPPNFELPRDRSPEPRLLILDREGQVLRVEPLREAVITVGRAPKNDVVLNHAGVSRHHLNIESEGDQVLVTDLSSTNGSALDRLKLPPMKRVPWPYGSALHVEPYWLILTAPHKAPPPARIGVSVDQDVLELVPGKTLSLPVHLANTGKTVDHFMLSVEGVPPEWVHNAFHEVQLNPGSRGDTALKLLAPKSTEQHAGDYPVRVIARSRENPEEVGFATMTWRLGAYADSLIEVAPKKRSAWFRTKYELSILNGGNLPLTYVPTIRDDEGAVRLQSPLSMSRIPQNGDLSQLIPWRAIIYAYWIQLREGFGKVRVAALSDGVTIAPGQRHNEPIKVRLPVRWIGTVRQHRLFLQIANDRERLSPLSLELRQNPVIPLWWIPLLLLLGGLGYTWAMRPPGIEDFEVTPLTPGLGQPFTVAWDTHGAYRVRLDPPGKLLPAGPGGKGSFTLPGGVNDPTTLKLTAYSRFKKVQRSLTVTPKLPAPVIGRFEVTPTAVTVGQTVTLRWNVANVKNVTLEPFGTVNARGEVKQKLTADTDFRLSAQSGGESVSKNVTVKLLPPEIQLFKVTPADAEPGQPVVIRWKVAGATDVNIDPLGTVESSGERQVTAQANTVYRLQAGNGQTSVSSSGAVNVVAKPPQVLSFDVQPRKVRPGDQYTLTWQTRDADSVQLVTPGGTQNVAQSGEITLSAPPQTAPLSLSAKNAQGKEDARTLSVVVLPPLPAPAPTVALPIPQAAPKPVLPAPPTVSYFNAAPAKIAQGGKVTLKWKILGADQVVIRPLGRTVGPRGTLSVAVPRDMSFTLVATGKGGQVSARQSVDVRTAPKPVQVKPAPKPAQAKVPVAPAPTAKAPTPKPAVSAPKPAIAAEPPEPKPQPAVPARPLSVTPPPDIKAEVIPAAPPARLPEIASFQASAESVPKNSNVTLSWNVEHAESVTLSGVGKVDPQGSRAVQVKRNTTFVLRATNGDGKAIAKIVQVAAEAQAKAPPSVQPNPASAKLAGVWKHSFGELNLQINGSEVSGTFSDSRGGEQGQVKGKLIRGSSTPYTMNARVLFPDKPDDVVSFVVSFDDSLNSFYGPYSRRSDRERWCGWRPNTPPPPECSQ